MSDFTINIDSNLNLSKAESQMNSFLSKYKNEPIKIKVDVDTKGINTSNFAKQIQSSFSSAGMNVGKAYNTALQTQINAMARTQRNAFSEPLKNMSKYEKSYSDMWNRLLSKAPVNYNKNQQMTAIDSYLVKVEQLSKKANDVQKKVSQKFLDVETSGVKKTLSKYYGTDTSGYKALEVSYNKLISLQKELKTGVSDDKFAKTLSNSDMVSKYDQFYEVLAKCKNEMKLLSNESSSFVKPFSSMDAITASNKTLTWLKNNSKAAKDYGDILNSLAEKQKNATTAGELKQYTKEVNAIKSQASAEGKTGVSTFAELKRAGSQILQFTSIYGVLQRIPQVIGNMANAVVEVDSAMTELRKVSDESDNQITQYFGHATDSAKKYGIEINKVINNTADWKRLGYSLDDASKLSDATTLLQRVGDNMTQESSSQGLISILKGFNYKAKDVNSIIDVINQVANTEPIDTSGIVSALQRSASSLSAAGNDLNQSVAMITAANSVVQDPDSVGEFCADVA